MKQSKTVFLVGLAFFLLTPELFSQENTVPEFNKLKTPSSPAFVLLGIEPTSAARPNTPSSLALEILNKTNNLADIPRDFALEFSPYWLFGHPDLTWQEDINRNIYTSVLRTATISFASAEIGDTTPVTGLSLGTRFSIISGKTSEESVESLKRLEALLGKEASLFNSYLEKKTRQLDERKESELRNAANDQQRNAIIEKYSLLEEIIKQEVASDPEYLEDINKAREDFQDFSVERDGFFLEGAFGFLWTTPNAVAGSIKFERFGGWLTSSYQWKKLSLVGVIRYLEDVYAVKNHSFDIGARCIYHDALFAVSFEYVKRILNVSDIKNQNRLVGNIEYNILGTTWLRGTFGKNYSSEEKGSLLAQLGISFNFSSQRFKFPE